MTQRFRVVVTDFIVDDLAPERAVLGDIADVVALNAMKESDLVGRIEDVDAMLMWHTFTLTEATISRLKHCKLITRCGVGYDNVDHVGARNHKIPVANVPDYGTEEVADSAIGLILSLTRGISFFNTRLLRGLTPWSHAQAAPLVRLRGRVLGIVGLGRIGTAVALRAKSLGMNVVFFDPHTPDGYDKSLGIRRAESLPELLKQSFVVTLHTPLTPETRHIISAKEIAMMPRGSYLVNTSRGDVLDVLAIPDAIRSGQLAGAGIDVLPVEPPPADHPLLVAWRNPADPCHDRVIMNPHAAFYSEEGLHDMRTKGAQACRRAILGERLRNIVN